MKGRAEGRLSKISGTWPATASVSAGLSHGKGTCTMKVCVPSLNISIIRWVMLPLPGEAYEYFAWLALHGSQHALVILKGSLG